MEKATASPAVEQPPHAAAANPISAPRSAAPNRSLEGLEPLCGAAAQVGKRGPARLSSWKLEGDRLQAHPRGRHAPVPCPAGPRVPTPGLLLWVTLPQEPPPSRTQGPSTSEPAGPTAFPHSVFCSACCGRPATPPAQTLALAGGRQGRRTQRRVRVLSPRVPRPEDSARHTHRGGQGPSRSWATSGTSPTASPVSLALSPWNPASFPSRGVRN